ncbi:hypothetical protein PR048_020458 [Dryococelus australis]|uniref:DUF4371 domain-containing protein n=1 Tax=Dryococelus australis TaxID=614101 RepID=A0ABQ9H6C3_9NEOP|nr:hypothetical protein PR048_020458 [Dryococelus australis]
MIPFTYAEVVKECMHQSVKVMEGEETVKKYQKIPLSNDTVTRRCNELVNNISCHFVSELSQSNFFPLAADESTNISDVTQLSVFVRFFLMERDLWKNFPYHCIIHNTVLRAKLSKDFFPLLTEIAKQVTFLRARSALTHRNLKQFLNDLDSEFKDVFLYNNVRRLSKGQMLNRVWGLREEIVILKELMDTSEKRDHFLNLLRAPN